MARKESTAWMNRSVLPAECLRTGKFEAGKVSIANPQVGTFPCLLVLAALDLAAIYLLLAFISLHPQPHADIMNIRLIA